MNELLTSVSGHHDHGGKIILQSSVEEGETLNIQHVDLINEENTWSDLGLALLSPLGHLNRGHDTGDR